MHTVDLNKPLIYEGEIQLRFSDLDSYGHLSATHYIDMVGSNRLMILENRFGISLSDLLKRGIGFYLARVEINYQKPVVGMVKIKQQSKVIKWERSKLAVEFNVLSLSGEIQHANGQLHYVVVDLKSGRPIDPPEWMLDCLFEKP